MRNALAPLSLALLVLTACSSEDRWDQLRPTHEGFCSDACQDAPSCADWSRPELADTDIQRCIEETPCGNDPAYACDASGSTTYDWDCYVGCVMMESQAVQDAVYENIRCEFPPDVCR